MIDAASPFGRRVAVACGEGLYGGDICACFVCGLYVRSPAAGGSAISSWLAADAFPTQREPGLRRHGRARWRVVDIVRYAFVGSGLALLSLFALRSPLRVFLLCGFAPPCSSSLAGEVGAAASMLSAGFSSAIGLEAVSLGVLGSRTPTGQYIYVQRLLWGQEREGSTYRRRLLLPTNTVLYIL